MAQVKMVVSQRGDKEGDKRKVIGSIDLWVPTLSDFGFDTEVAAEADDEGLPTYKEAAAQYVYDAVVAAVKATARNKLVPGTAQRKDGNKLATSVAELLEVGQRGGNGEALKFLRELKDTFAVWISNSGKSESAQASLIMLFGNRNAVSVLSASMKEKFAVIVGDFAGSLEEDVLAKAEKYLDSLLAATSSSFAEDNF